MARPREFDKEKTLGTVMNLFWEKGFHETTLEDLTSATGLKKASLYACFGNKENLFKKALTLYSEKGPFVRLNLKGTALNRLAAFYEHQITGVTDRKGQRKGCFLFNSCLEFSNKKGSLAIFVKDRSKRNETFFEALIREAMITGEISSQVDLEKITGRAYATAFTIREISKFRPEKDFLKDIADTFFKSIDSEIKVFHKEKLR